MTHNENEELVRLVELDGNVAVLSLDYVEGHVYFNDSDATYCVPAATYPRAYIADCWVIPAEDWNNGIRPEHLQQQGELPVPVRRNELTPYGWLDEFMQPKLENARSRIAKH